MQAAHPKTIPCTAAELCYTDCISQQVFDSTLADERTSMKESFRPRHKAKLGSSLTNTRLARVVFDQGNIYHSMWHVFCHLRMGLAAGSMQGGGSGGAHIRGELDLLGVGILYTQGRLSVAHGCKAAPSSVHKTCSQEHPVSRYKSCCKPQSENITATFIS